MAQIDYRELPVRELYLYMNLVMGFCADMRRLLRERNLTADAIDKSALRSPAAGMTNSFSTEFFTSATRRSASSCESV